MSLVNADSIRHMFASVAPKYDITNSVLSFGIHHLWKRKVIELARLQQGSQILDCATGTGDLAFAFRKKLGDKGRVVGIDFCEEMLVEARKKPGAESIEFIQADAMKLPFPENSFDTCTISFGIRNVEEPAQALSEMARVCKAGGKVIVLEFGQPDTPVFASLYNAYSNYLLPAAGGLLTGKPSAYRYLQKSSAQFPSGQKFKKLMMETGSFTEVDLIKLTGGIAYIYIGQV